MHELSKSIQRRLHDANFVTRYFAGAGIDIGSGPDPLSQYVELFPLISNVRAWDIKDGDAELMAGCPDNQYDFVHSSHCLEHMRNPNVALKNWFRILRPGGHLIVLVPDEDLYEQGVFPSTFNKDHKWTFTPFKTRSWSNRSCNVIDLIKQLGECADLIKLEQLTGSYRFRMPRRDQTQTPIGEAAIEFIVRKRPAAEIDMGGCLQNARKARGDGSGVTVRTIYQNLGRVRGAQVSGLQSDFPQTVVVPHATYSPWQQAKTFKAAYESIKRHSLVDVYRCYDLWCLIKQTANLSGDVLEVGVWRGGTGCLLGLAILDARISANLYLADTFAGVVKAGAVDTSYKGGEHADTTVDTVKELLAANGVDRYCILQGVFPDETSRQVSPGPIRFCHIDVDVYQSAKDIFEWVWPRLPIGGIVIFDDYGFATCSGVTTFVNSQVGRDDLVMMHNLNGHAVMVRTR